MFLTRNRKHVFLTKSPKPFLFGDSFTTRKVSLKQLQANESQKILGIEITITADQRYQVVNMVSRVSEWYEDLERGGVWDHLQRRRYRPDL